MLERGDERGELSAISSQFGGGEGVRDIAEDGDRSPWALCHGGPSSNVCRVVVLGVGERRSICEAVPDVQ